MCLLNSAFVSYVYLRMVTLGLRFELLILFLSSGIFRCRSRGQLNTFDEEAFTTLFGALVSVLTRRYVD